MGNGNSSSEKFAKLTESEQALIKDIWKGIENNPQFHGSVFFPGLCEIHPEYTKYFTTDAHVPLTFDARTNAKFTVIMETMGYLLLDFHKKPKQLEHIIGYIALIHKDMNLARSDMTNFGNCLLKYLTVTFPAIMTPEAQLVITNYMNHLLDAIAEKIEEFNKDETFSRYEPDSRKTSCGAWFFWRENLLYGHTLEYWKDRKIRWQERLEDWKATEARILHPPVNSSTEDEENSAVKSKTEDETSEFAESTARLLESHGIIPRTTRIHTQAQSLDKGFRQANRKTVESKKLSDWSRKHGIIAGEDVTRDTTVALKTPRERRRSLMARASRLEGKSIRIGSISDEPIKSSFGMSVLAYTESQDSRVPLTSQKSDSLARQRRRTTQRRI